MRTSVLLAFVCAMGLSLLSVPAHAQATRTWVSGVGDDANPCSRTAPCKTFAGAISKTSTGGEINCIDAGGFGTLTITKSIAIKCQYTEAGVLATGTNGINVNAAGAIVYLEGIDFEQGLVGINFIAGASLYVNNCVIRAFSTVGISFTPNQATASVLTVDNTVITDQVVSPPNGGGILMAPTGGGTVLAQITNTRSVHNTFGYKVQDNAKATISNSVGSNNNNGVVVVSTSAAAEANVFNSTLANNPSAGIATNGANATVHMAYTSILDNGTGISITGGTVFGTSPGTNLNAGNGTPGAPNGTAVALQ